MLLTEYSIKENWYFSYVDEILSGIALDEIEINEEIFIKDSDDCVLHFTIAFCRAINKKLLETNNKREIHIYLASLRIASYNIDFILNGIYKRSKDFFINRPVLYIFLFSRENIFRYHTLRTIYEEWHQEN